MHALVCVYNTHTQLFYCSSGICPGPPGWAGTRKVKSGRLNQSGFTGARDSEWQWHLLGNMQVCTSTQTTMPTSHHSVFYRPDALPAAQPTASKHWRDEHWKDGHWSCRPLMSVLIFYWFLSAKKLAVVRCCNIMSSSCLKLPVFKTDVEYLSCIQSSGL